MTGILKQIFNPFSLGLIAMIFYNLVLFSVVLALVYRYLVPETSKASFRETVPWFFKLGEYVSSG